MKVDHVPANFPELRELELGNRMDRPRENRTQEEIERLRDALEIEISQRLQVQRRLERTSADFEDFVSNASHSLLEPLRAIRSYSELIAKAYAGQLDSDADLFFGRIQESVARMQCLLVDMVEYWTTDGGERQSSLVDMEAVFCQAVLCADKQIKERKANVTHDPLPMVTGNFEMLTKVLNQLVMNAVKFCGASSPRVHISYKRENLEFVFSVEDNGPGIEPEFSERIFAVFKRLHGNEYPGVGLGLAFCKKAIEAHGGRIWVESTPGNGATFYFTLRPAG